MKKLCAAFIVFALAIGLASVRDGQAEPSRLPRRAHVAMVASDGFPPEPSKPVPPPPGPNYCGPVPGVPTPGLPSVPNAMFGLFTIAGAPAPEATLVTLTFDGERGPSIYTAKAGGYAFFYAAGGQGHVPACANVVGSAMGLLVNGTIHDTGVKVGDPVANPALRYDLAVP